MAIFQHITLTNEQRSIILGAIEGHLNEVETRLSFLVEHFGATDAKMDPAVHHLFLCDCRDGVLAARAAWEEAWVSTGGASSYPESADGEEDSANG